MALVIGGVDMKNRSLFNRSMIWVIVPMIVMSLTITLTAQYVIKNYFRRDSFRLLDAEYERLITTLENTKERASTIQSSMPSVNMADLKLRVLEALPLSLKPTKETKSVFVLEYTNGEFGYLNSRLPFGDAIIEELKDNKAWPLHGETIDEQETVFYSVRPFDFELTSKRVPAENIVSTYYLSYISERYSQELTQNVMVVFIIGMSVFILTIGTILFFLFKQIGKRLSHLEQGSQAIGMGHFNTTINSLPYDEIGRLGESMNRMGRQLALIQEEQANHFQTISHELKTPIMVMQGYVDALINEQYPNGTKEASYEIVMSELNKLEQLTKDLILLNKSDYLARNNITMTHLDMRMLFEKVIQKHHREDLMISIVGEKNITGDEASWLRIIENIMTNQLRYAQSKIDVVLGDGIYVSNDGEPIDEQLLNRIKEPFVKGRQGRSGLGLTIIANTLKLYHYTLSIKNTQHGVLYTIEKEN